MKNSPMDIYPSGNAFYAAFFFFIIINTTTATSARITVIDIITIGAALLDEPFSSASEFVWLDDVVL